MGGIRARVGARISRRCAGARCAPARPSERGGAEHPGQPWQDTRAGGAAGLIRNRSAGTVPAGIEEAK